MRHVRRRALLLTIFVSGCASHQSGGSGGGGAAGDAVGIGRWYGQLKQLNQASIATLQTSMPTGATAASYGQVTVLPMGAPPGAAPGEARGRLRFEVSITAPAYAGDNIAWAAFSGPCGSPLPPIAPLTDFPVLEVTNSGAARVRVELATALEPRGTYHVNVYEGSRATDVANVLLCANLKYQRR